jgi:hypothetical protein
MWRRPHLLEVLGFLPGLRNIVGVPPVIRASGDARDFRPPADGGRPPTRTAWIGFAVEIEGAAPVPAAAWLRKEARVHKVAGMPLPTEADKDDTLGSLVLARIASAPSGLGSGLDRGVLAADLAMFAGPQMPASHWRKAVDRAIERLGSARLIAAKPGGLMATPAGMAAAARFLGAPARAMLAWEQVCNVWLMAKALGVKRTPAKRLASLATAEGLRAAILMHAYGLSFKGEPTPTRLRQALAAAALKRAFGGQGAGRGAASLADKLGLSARASRLLAAQLMDKPRDPGTDRRLVSALAAQACGAASAELPAMRAGVLRRFLAPWQMGPTAGLKQSDSHPVPVAPEARARSVEEGHGGGSPRTTKVGSSPITSPQAEGESACARTEAGASSSASPSPAPAAPSAPPLDLPGFTSEVRRCAAGEAQGWSGDRKAYISRVWRSLREQRPDWRLSEIEFKGMLAEAHRLGQLALANADLKDASNIKDVQDSALSYKNAVFHFIRVDA